MGNMLLYIAIIFNLGCEPLLDRRKINYSPKWRLTQMLTEKINSQRLGEVS